MYGIILITNSNSEKLLKLIFIYLKTKVIIRKKEENKFTVFDGKNLSEIYGPVKYNITEEWRRNENIEL